MQVIVLDDADEVGRVAAAKIAHVARQAAQEEAADARGTGSSTRR